MPTGPRFLSDQQEGERHMSRATSNPYDVRGRTVLITGPRAGSAPGRPSACTPRGRTSRWSAWSPSSLEEHAVRLGPDRAAWFEADVTDFEALRNRRRRDRRALRRHRRRDRERRPRLPRVARDGADRAGRAHARGQPARRVAHRPGGDRADRRAPRLPAEHRLAGRRHAHADDGAVYDPQRPAWRLCPTPCGGETAPSGARIGCAYFGFIDTDLVRA